MVENINTKIIGSEQSQEKLKEIVKNSYDMYMNCVYNLCFLPLRIRALDKELETATLEDDIKAKNSAKTNAESEIRSNQEWLKQYEEVIPYLETLLTNHI